MPQIAPPDAIQGLSFIAAAFSFYTIAAQIHGNRTCSVPMQFDLAGTPTWYMEGCGWLYVFPVCALLMAWIPVAARKHKWRVNNPKFLGDGNREGPLRDLVLLYLDVMMFSVCALFAFISWKLPRIATDGGALSEATHRPSHPATALSARVCVRVRAQSHGGPSRRGWRFSSR